MSTYPSDSYPGLQRESMKDGMVDRLHQQLAVLHEEIEQLSHRLCPVLSPSPEVAASIQPQEAPANRLHEAILEAERAHRRLRSINSELHL